MTFSHIMQQVIELSGKHQYSLKTAEANLIEVYFHENYLGHVFFDENGTVRLYANKNGMHYAYQISDPEFLKNLAKKIKKEL